ncbi:MAG: TIGR03619 family F420-dependent LLM class oxidoreductase [Acidimicrobiales bacterium]
MSVRPAVGIFPSCTDRSMPIIELARAAEERGFTTIFLNEHTHIPVDHPRSEWPGGGPTPDTYGRFWDPYIALAFVAALTGLEVGTAVSLIAEHDPLALAKAIASLDVLSGGRVVLGVGWGWNREEFEDHGRGPARLRASVMLEHLEVMRRLWAEDVASFSGDNVHLVPSHAWPKPVHGGTVPVLLGAPSSERNIDRVVAHYDGWIPMGANALFDDGLEPALTELRHRWAVAGRDGTGPRITAIQAAGSAGRLASALDRAAELDVERVIVHVGELGERDSLNLLDCLAPALSAR